MKILLLSVLLSTLSFSAYANHNYVWKNKAEQSKIVYMNVGTVKVDDFHNNKIKFNKPVKYKVHNFVIKQKRLSWN